jgi:hypothetical protein
MISHGNQLSDEQLTTELADRAMRWRISPDRYLRPDGGWIPRSKFCPLVNVSHAFQALDAVTKDYSLLAKPGGGFEVNLRLACRTACATDESKARAICLALADALGINVLTAPNECGQKTSTIGGNRGR